MRDKIGQPLEIGDRVQILSNWHISATVIRFTQKMVVVEKHNKTGTRETIYPINLISLEANFEKYPELVL